MGIDRLNVWLCTQNNKGSNLQLDPGRFFSLSKAYIPQNETVLHCQHSVLLKHSRAVTNYYYVIVTSTNFPTVSHSSIKQTAHISGSLSTASWLLTALLMLQVWVLLVCNSLHIMEQYRPSRSLHHHASTSSRAACLHGTTGLCLESIKQIDQRKQIRYRGVKFVCKQKKTVKLCRNVWSMHGVQLLHSAQFLSLAVKVGHQYVPSTVPAHGLLPQAFLLVMQTARSWSFQFATVPVLIGMIHLLWYVAQSPQ